MAITEKELAEYTEICNDAAECPRLNDWEQTFLTGIWEKLELYGQQTRVSDKQAGILRRIAKEKIYV